MTWLGIGTAVLLLVYCFIGYKRGFIKEVVSVGFVVLAVAITWLISPYVSSFLKDRTPVYTKIQESCQEVLAEQMGPEEDVGREVQTGIIDSLPLPDSVKGGLRENNNSEVYQFLDVDTFAEYVSGYLATALTNGLGFLLSYLLAGLLIKIIAAALDIVSRLPVLRGINRLAGFVLGGVKGLILVWILLLVLTVLYNTEVGAACMRMVEKDKFMSYLYDRNLFVQVFMSIFYGK